VVKNFLLLSLLLVIYNINCCLEVYSKYLSCLININNLMKTSYSSFFSIFLLLFICITVTKAQNLFNNQSIDATFGFKGFVITQPPSDSTQINLFDLLLQNDDKVIALGNSLVQGYNKPYLIKYNPNGSIDNSFTPQIPVFNFSHLYIHSGVLQNDGKIVIAMSLISYTIPNDSGRKLCLVRYLPNGLIDTSFGSNGLKITDLADFGETTSDIYPYKILLQDDEKIIVIGHKTFNRFSKKTSQTSSFVAKFETNGEFDYSFGTSGVATTSGLGYSNPSGGGTIQRDGKIVIFGGTSPVSSTTATNSFVMRFNPDGTIDDSFSNNLLPSYISSPNFLSSSIKSLSDGSILLSTRSKLYRLTSNGEIDNSFISTSVYNNNSPVYIFSFAVQNDEKIVVSGVVGCERVCGALVRFLPNGQIDKTFGNNGVVIQSGFKRDFNYPKLLIQSDNKIILAGTHNFYQTGAHFLVSKYTESFIFSGK
jgi:uncharacterized delta-60 repeat protein